jgi:hypothetical protein
MATAVPPPNTWSAYPFPSTIMLYNEGQGYPKFDSAKTKSYFTNVNDKNRGSDSGNNQEMGHGGSVRLSTLDVLHHLNGK